MPVTVRQTYLVILAAAGSLALLLVNSTAGLAASPLMRGEPMLALIISAPAAATVLALLAWHLAPARSWAWLLLAGALCALPNPLLQLNPDLLTSEEMFEAVLAVTMAGPPLTLVGLLGAATLVWRSGRAAVASGLAGAALAIGLVEPLVSVTLTSPDNSWIAWYERDFLPRLTLVLAGLAVVAAVAGIVARPPRIDSPPPRVTAAASLASLAPLLLLAWPSIRTSLNTGDLGDALFHVGLVLLAVGLVAGAAVGGAALLGALAAGLALGVFGTLVSVGLVVQRELPALAVAVALAAVPLGFLAAMSRLRLRFGVGGLLVVAAGLVILYLLSTSDSLNGTDGTARIIEPVLIVAAGVGTVAGVATIGATLAERAAAPAVLAGLTVPFVLGTTSILLHEALTGVAGGVLRDEMSDTPLLLAAAGLGVAAVALLGIAGTLGRRRQEGEVGAPVPAASEIA
jgi:hypothetical protein